MVFSTRLNGRNDRTKCWLAVLTALLVIGAGAFVGLGIMRAAEYQQQASTNASAHAKAVEQRIQLSCPRLPPVYRTACVMQARDGQREYERQEDELAAQRATAFWSFVMAASAVFGMALSVIGVLLVWRTFAETRKANEIANDTLDGQLRPWIEFSVERTSAKSNGHVIDLGLRISLKHHGTSPALDFVCVPKLFVGEYWASDRTFNYMPILHDSDADSRRRTVFPGEEWSEWPRVQEEIPEPVVHATLIVAAFYRSPYSKKVRATCKVFDVGHVKNESLMLDWSGTEPHRNVLIRPRDDRGDYTN